MAAGIAYLGARRLQRTLTAGLQRLASERDYLNSINVFPVPDGDTGNNLAQTALAGQGALAMYAGDNAGEALVVLADAALDSSQGNSGALLAQFFQGLAISIDDRTRVTTSDIAKAFRHAAGYTRSALDNPREGTIISAIDAAAAAAEEHADSNDFAELLPAITAAANDALEASTGQLAELRKAGVVDAGAAGFCAILEGCTDYLLTGSIRDELPAPVTGERFFAEEHQHTATSLTYRYCTECLLSGTDMDQAAIRTELGSLGDSIVVAGSPLRVRVHVHSNDPELVFERMAGFGELQKKKADDMLGQARSLSRTDRDIVIVTDSAADLTETIMTDLDIHMVPLRILFGDASYLDKIGMSPADFRAELDNNPAAPGTSAPTQGDFRRMYEFLATHFGEVLSIHASGSLSSTYQGAVTAAAATSAPDKITCMDSLNASVAQGLIVKRAAELAAAGMRGAELQAAVKREIAGVQAFALVTDLSSAVRSGRVKPTIKKIADLLHLTPVLRNTAAGKVGASGFLPGKHRLVERFARYVARKVERKGAGENGAGENSAAENGSWEIAIAHGADERSDAEELESQLRARLNNVTEAWLTEIGPALGVHAGMSALVVALRRTD